jgi:hypothetical protein
MRSSPIFPFRTSVAAVAAGGLVWLLGAALDARAAPALSADEEAKIHDALAWGVRYLIATQGPLGTWALQEKDAHKVAYAALPGLTLLECGVPTRHPSVRAAAAYVRGSYLNTEDTYDAALAILFLDHLYQYNRDLAAHLDEAMLDRRIIQVLALRLIAAQTKTGGWSYTCKQMSTAEHLKLLGLLREPKLERYRIPQKFRSLPIFRDPDKLMVKPKPVRKRPGQKEPAAAPPADSDNSNTHFALLGLWVAQRYGVPVERSFRLIGKRFRTSQNSNGSWGYTWGYGGGIPESPAMTCAGLLGMVMQYGFKDAAEATGVLSAPRGVAQLVGALTGLSPLAHVGAAYQAHRALDADAVRRKQDQDGPIGFALTSLGAHLGDPTGRSTGLAMPNLYFLWAVERVAVIYGLTTIASKDWYRWGAEAVVANQKPDGYWDKSGYPGSTPVLDTCFALFFLKQANLAKDLTARLQSDPDALSKLKREQPAPAAPKTPAQPSAPPQQIASAAPPVAKPAPARQDSAAKTTPEPTTAAPVPPVVAPAKDGAGEQPAGSRVWLWVVLLVVALLFIGSGVALTILSRRKPVAEPRRPRAGNSKKKPESSGRHVEGGKNGATKADKQHAAPPGAGKADQSGIRKSKRERFARGD